VLFRSVENCNFNLANQTLQIEYIPGIVLVRVVEKTIAYATGIKIVWRENSAVADEEHEKESLLKIKVQFLNSIFATISAVIIFILMMPGLFEFVTIWPESIRNGVAFLLSTWSLFFAGRSIFKGFIAKLAPGHSDMNTLVSLGAGTAWVYSTFVMAGKWYNPEALANLPLFFDSAAFIIGFILLGRSLEARARRQTGVALKTVKSDKLKV